MRFDAATTGPSPGPPAGFRGIYRDDLAARAVYAEAAGVARVVPRGIAVPADAGDVQTLVRWAQAARVALVPRGSGSGMAGGAVGAGIVVDLSRLRAIGDVDPRARRVVVGPGAVRDAVDAAARAAGLRVPVDPSSGAFCTVGGMIAANAAGPRSFRFGATRRWVAALDCVFDDGSRAVIRRGAPAPAHVPAVARFLADTGPAIREATRGAHRSPLRKNASGYASGEFAESGELIDLMVGSEGTLALFVGVELALAPVAARTATLLASFAALPDAVGATAVVRDAAGASADHGPAAVTDGAASARAASGGIGPSACELIDRTFLDVAREGGPLPVHADSEAVLLIELEGDADAEAGMASAADDLARRLRASGATEVTIGLDATSEHRLWALRHAASPILSRLDPALKSMQFIEDGVVPPDRLGDYVRGVRSALAARGVRGVIFGHAGDAHVHVNPLIDVRRPDWRSRVEALLADVVELTVSLGGSLSGEHGDGRLRAPLLTRTLGPAAVALMAAIKHAFDPAGILNPGAKVALPGQVALGDIKYDPALPPPPPPAARVLARVERERAYADFRLAMLERVTGTR